ncbi:hypothetical protein TanjilG_23337 [Lupinus angustifolius]|uniref:Uncharacterized protein n=1 Tax=Lupinus angustifolius TaxID=3871 RepID=A0A4P1R995_LUPAN|nr:PREDICTED: protein OBERON 4 [Lupinus angustifolius]OIW05551.1 hypothetical protein TanjilG_23337 [Lupinus angustifolius]
MKRLRSSEDLHSYGDKKDSNSNSNSSSNLNRTFSSSSSAQRTTFYYKSDNARNPLIYSSPSSSRYDRDRTLDDDRDASRSLRKHDLDRRRYRDGGGGGSGGGDRSMTPRSESLCGSRRDVPKGFRSERDRSRREGSVSSWRRGLKDFDERGKSRVVVGMEERIVLTRSPRSFNVKSPTWSKDSESDHSKKMSSAKSLSKSKSPTCSKDSESDQSKSVELVNKTEELQLESATSSEMEEGELKPEPVLHIQQQPPSQLNPGITSEDQHSIPSEIDGKQVRNECHTNDTDTAMDEGHQISSENEEKPMEVVVSEVKDAELEADKVSDVQDDPNKKLIVTDTEIDTVTECLKDNKKDECVKAVIECGEEETKKGADMEVLLSNEEEHKQEKGVDVESSSDVDIPQLKDEVSTENEAAKEVINRETMTETVANNNARDKGKSISVTPTDVAHSSENALWIDKGPRDLATCAADVIEGPSTRGFELFSRSPVRKVEKTGHSDLNKQKDESLGMEQLDLSLSLPNVLLPVGALETTTQVPGSPSQARSVQSLSNTFCSNSDGFTASMSFSGSQSLYHDPSCSLTKNTLDFEQSVGSRPLFQGIDWQAQSQSDPKQKEVQFSQRAPTNGNGSFHHSQPPWGILDAVKVQQPRVLEGSSKLVNGLEKHLSFHKHLSGHSRHHDDVRSPSHSVGSQDIGSNYSFEKKRDIRDRNSGGLNRTTSYKEQEQVLGGGVDFVETIIAKIVSESVHVMSRKFHEMTGQSMACLKEGIREVMLNADKHGQILAFQKVLQNRSDITLEVLLKCHRVQLEVLVALKTGLTHYLHIDNNNISSSELAQVFLNLRCRNLSCRSQLPVDECDCKVCMQKNGFCRECMCLVCSKFDDASNTCSWVGCDVCLHWCHTDCGLRESYIRNGHSTTGMKGMTEMQFHCIACDHPSEMFGFVKEVFHNFAKDWSVETLCKELEYVKRIFSSSKDMRGRQLHEIAGLMLPRLENKSKLPEVLRHIMSFLSDSGDSSKLARAPSFSGKEPVKHNNGVAGPSQEAAWLKSIYQEKPPLLERSASILPSFDRSDKRSLTQELHISSVQKDFGFDELESVIKIKQAEAKMFQARADDARREAEGLKRISLAKNEKHEEEYANRIAKLRLAETEEMRKQKFEELQALERAHLEYFNMKMRMDADIRDLLSKMEATKRSLAM